MPIPTPRHCLAIASCLSLFGCGSGSNPSTDQVYPADTGFFVDSPVGNVDYRTASRQGATDPDGAFAYVAGEQVTFVLGSLALPPTQGRLQITPIDLFGTAENRAANQFNRPAFNLAVLLISLDQDSDPANGIFLSDVARAALLAHDLAGLVFDTTTDIFAASIAGVVADSGTASGQVASAAQVSAHLAASLGATPADSDGDGLYDYEDPLPFDGGQDGARMAAATRRSANWTGRASPLWAKVRPPSSSTCPVGPPSASRPTTPLARRAMACWWGPRRTWMTCWTSRRAVDWSWTVPRCTP